MSKYENSAAQRVYGGAAICGLVVAVTSVLPIRAKWVEVPLPYLVAVWAALPALLVRLSIYVLARKWPRARLSKVGVLCVSLCIFAGGLFAVVPLRICLAAYDSYKAKRFCDFLTPVLERYRAEWGDYPYDISWFLQEQDDLPRLIKEGFQYYRRDGAFAYHIVSPDQPFAWQVYDSKKGAWELEFD